MGYKLCDASDLPGINAEFVKRGINSSMYCPINKRYKISGNYMKINIENDNVLAINN